MKNELCLMKYAPYARIILFLFAHSRQKVIKSIEIMNEIAHQLLVRRTLIDFELFYKKLKISIVNKTAQLVINCLRYLFTKKQ